jgi:hypothetical protein
MQDVDRVGDIEAFAQPPRERCPRVQVKPLRLVPRAQDLRRIGGHAEGRRDLGERAAVRSPEPQLAIGRSFDVAAAFMNGAVVPATEHGEIRQHGRASLGPVADMMPLAEADAAAGEAAAPVPVLQGSA